MPGAMLVHRVGLGFTLGGRKNQLQDIHKKLRWLAGSALLAIALTAGTLGMVLNVSHGMEAGLAAGIAFGLADAAKISIPLVAGLIGWSRQMKATAAICVAVSLWSAINVYLDGAGAAMLAKQHGAEIYAQTAKATAELEAEAARLTALATAEAAKRGCKQNCRALNEQASAARQRLQEARALRAAAKPVQISGMAAVISAAAGVGQNDAARAIGVVKALLLLVLIEALCWLSLPALQLLRQPAKVAAPADIPLATTTTEPELQSVANPAPVTVSKGGKAYYMARLTRDFPDIATRVQRGEMSVYAATVAAGIRKPAGKKWTTPADYGIKTERA